MKAKPRSLRCLFALTLLLMGAPASAGPLLDFSFFAFNLQENAELFTFTFSLPYTAGPYDTLESSFSSTITDGDGTGGAAATPAAASGFMMVPALDGVDVAAGGLGAGCALVGAPFFTDAVCDALSTATVGVVTLPDGTFSATVSFFLSSGDSISGQGTLELKNEASPVPEPLTAFLLGLGLSAIAIHRRRSQSTRQRQ